MISVNVALSYYFLNRQENTAKRLVKINSILFIVLNTCFMIGEVTLILMMLGVLEKNMSKFYHQHSKNFKMLAVINIIYYLVEIVMYSYMIGKVRTDFKINLIGYKTSFNKAITLNEETEASIYSMGILMFLNQICPLVYAYFNIRNVQFKRYVLMMLKGIHVESTLEDSSLFIALS
mmetsp:Transcript_18705/g.16567  ORF Transcript_18705/g.16567 Transcript_18705/m.16567 type:complete len:177 (+) Transcript_18705:476-1006(+)